MLVKYLYNKTYRPLMLHKSIWVFHSSDSFGRKRQKKSKKFGFSYFISNFVA